MSSKATHTIVGLAVGYTLVKVGHQEGWYAAALFCWGLSRI